MFGGMRELAELIKKQGQILDRIDMQRVQRLINPPLITRDRCRFCGKPLKVTDEVKPRRNGPFAELYAHSACYKREVR